MLKLMKYEFRKLRTALLSLAAALVALEAGFIAGLALNRNTMMAVCLGLLTLLVFLVYAYIVVAGIASYDRELREKSGYLVFMVPVRPIGVVLSKLLFTALTALAAMALFGVAAYLDFRYLINRMNVDPEVVGQINMVLRFGLRANADLGQILRMAGFVVLTVLIQLMLTMCTAYLSVTVAATLLQNKKGFLRTLISLAVFIALTWGSNWLAQRLFYESVAIDTPFSEMTGTVAGALGLNLALCAVYCFASAWLLDHKVNL